MSSNSDSKSNYVQLSKPYITLQEIEFIEKNNVDLFQNIRDFKSKTRETFQLLINLVIKLKLPIRILQNSSYFYQKFYLLNNNYKKYSNLHFEVGIAVLFISLKLNDFIKKVSIVISEAFALKGVHLSNNDIEENKRIIISLERKILEFQSFDFRNFLIEDFLVKFLKYFENNNTLTIHDKKMFFYLSWTISNDLYLTSLVLQYPAHYNAIISIKCSILIFNEINNLNNNDNKFKPLDLDFDKIIENIHDNSFILSGCNQLLEYFIDNMNITFIKNSLQELNFKIDDKKLVDSLLNIKIEISNQLSSQNNNINNINNKETMNLQHDLFFKSRDTEIAKNGSIRFLYNKKKFCDEIKLYK